MLGRTVNEKKDEQEGKKLKLFMDLTQPKQTWVQSKHADKQLEFEE